MQYLSLTRTNLTVSRISLGCEQLGGCDWGRYDSVAMESAVECALEAGVTLFDTADVYGPEKSEERLASILGPRRKDVIIATKFGVGWRDEGEGRRASTYRDCSRRRVREALEGSLRRLQLDCIPLYQIHWPDPNTPIAETLDELDRCRQAGKLRHIGVSNFPAPLLREACGMAEILTAQFPYSVLERGIEEKALPLCKEWGVGVLVYGPLAHGLLSGKYDQQACFGSDDRRSRLPAFCGEELETNLRVVQAVKDVARKCCRTPAQVALRWVLRNPHVACVIVGSKSAVQVRENLSAFDWDLSEDDYRQLNDASSHRSSSTPNTPGPLGS